jgi:hypothetical protein
MNKKYIFSPATNVRHDNFNLTDNPYSGYVCLSLSAAYRWAETLLNFNVDFDAIQFKAENGKKVYTLYRLTDQDIEMTFTYSYIECLLWSSSEDEISECASYLDLADETLSKIKEDCKNFAKKARIYFTPDNLEQMGHDFALTRNHQGAGFWDGDWPGIGNKLTKIAQSFPEQETYSGDDRKIYVY